jgi:hypothetical protein
MTSTISTRAQRDGNCEIIWQHRNALGLRCGTLDRKPTVFGPVNCHPGRTTISLEIPSCASARAMKNHPRLLTRGFGVRLGSSRADVPVFLRVFFRDHLAIVFPQHSFRMVRLQACPGEAFCGDSVGAEGMSQDIWSPHNPRLLGGLLHHPLQFAIWFY